MPQDLQEPPDVESGIQPASAPSQLRKQGQQQQQQQQPQPTGKQQAHQRQLERQQQQQKQQQQGREARPVLQDVYASQTQQADCEDAEGDIGGDHDEEPVELRAALNRLVGDIYAICVRYIVACYDPDVGPLYKRDMRKKFAWLISAALFTFILQLSLVILLWHAMTFGNSPLVQPETERLWQQVGLNNQLTCRIQQAEKDKSATGRVDLPDMEKCDCSSWWPRGALSYETAKICLSQPWPSARFQQADCSPVILSLNASYLAYGRGLFFNSTRFVDEDSNSTSDGLFAGETLALGAELDPNWRLDPVFFIMFAYLQLAVAVHQEFKQGVWLCYIASGCVGILPAFFGQVTTKPGSHWRIKIHQTLQQEIPSLLKTVIVLVPMLQLLAALAVLATGGALFLFAQIQTDAVSIIINSVALAFVLEVDNKIGAIINLQEDWTYPATPPRSTPSNTSTTSQDLQPAQQGPQQVQQLAMMKGPVCQQPATARAAAHGTADAQPIAGVSTHASPRRTIWHWRCCGRLKLLLGHVYLGTLGALIYAEVMFLAPQSAAQLLSFVVVVFRGVGRVDTGAVAVRRGFGLPPALIGNLKTPTTDWFNSQGLWYHWSFGGWMDGYFEAKHQVFTPQQLSDPSLPPAFWIIMAYISFLVCSVLFVVLLCVRILPSCTRYWTVGLLVTQVWVMFLAQFQDSTFNPKCSLSEIYGGYLSTTTLQSIYREPLLSKCPRYFWWLVLLGNAFFCWLVMFIIVPAQMGFCCSREKPTSFSLTEPAADSAAQPGSPGRDESFYTANSKDVGQGYPSPGTG